MHGRISTFARNTLKYIADKDRKNFANDLKTIYHSPDEETTHRNMLTVSEKWGKKYPGAMARWEANWNVISPMFKFSETVRKVIYTTNAIESLSSGYRRLNRGRSVFPDSRALFKALYLATHDLTEKWTNVIRDWGKVYAELSVMSRQIQLNPPPSLTERCKNGILISPKAKATKKYAHLNFKRSRPADDTIFAPTRQGRSAPPTAVAGAAASALQSKNIRSLPINCPFYRKFLTEPGLRKNSAPQNEVRRKYNYSAL